MSLFVCMLPTAGRTAGPIKTKLGIATHVDPGSVLVKVKVMYLCVRYACATWRVVVYQAATPQKTLLRAISLV